MTINRKKKSHLSVETKKWELGQADGRIPKNQSKKVKSNQFGK